MHNTIFARPRILALAIAASSSFALAACATPYTGPVEVTRFVATDAGTLGTGTIGVVAGTPSPGILRAPYDEAVRAELAALGYIVDPRNAAQQTAEISVERYGVDRAGRRGPVSVGVGGGTGGYGSGVGLGVGINLGGGERPREVTQLSVRIIGAANAVLWEGRAELVTSDNAALADPAANAAALARALFAEFPGNNGETIEVDATR